MAERAALIRRVGELHAEQSERLAEIIVREMGKPIEAAIGEVEFCKAIYDFYADNAETLMADEPITLLDGAGSALVRRSSIGVLLGIMPWNYPYYQVARFAGPNLVIGNTILLKHAPQCPESAAAMEEIFREAGFPEGRLHQHLRHQRADRVGDRRPARARRVAHRLRACRRRRGRDRRAQPEEGRARARRVGSVHPARRPTTSTKPSRPLSSARLENTGQACNAGKRFIVVDELYEPFLEKFTAALTAVKPGDPKSKETTIGPLSSATAADRLDDQVHRAVEHGAKLIAGGGRKGNFFEPTVLTDITPDNDAYREEFFGPVAQVFRAADEDEAVRLANDTPYGLGSYVMTNDPEQAERVADKIDAGMVFINAVGGEGAELPFGGVKRSGFGRELGRYGADEFVNKKMIRIGG